MPHCSECKRRFRDAAAYQLYLRRRAIKESLRNDTPCAHLAPITEPSLSKQDTKRANSAHFVQHGELQH